MSQSVKIRKASFLNRLFCKHRHFCAWRIGEDTQNGTTIYKVCLKCGRVKKLKYITSDHYSDYEWSNIHMFEEQKKSIRALVNDNYRQVHDE